MIDETKLARAICLGVAEWRKLPRVLESGGLVKGSGGWYRVKDHRVLDEVRWLVKGLRANKAGTLTHVQLSKPSKALIAFADAFDDAFAAAFAAELRGGKDRNA